MYRLAAFTVDADGLERPWPRGYVLYPEEVEVFSRETETAIATFCQPGASADHAPDGYAIENDRGQRVFRYAKQPVRT